MIDRVERAIRSSWSGFFFSTIAPENCPRILDSEGFTMMKTKNSPNYSIQWEEKLHRFFFLTKIPRCVLS